MNAVAQTAAANGATAGNGPAGVQAGSSNVSGNASGSSQTAVQMSAATDRYLTPVQTELTGKVDSKSAVVGQEVTAKTSQAIRLADGTVLPKGTKLVGHVTEVQAHTKSEAGAILGLAFDRAELKGGQSLALRSVMQAVAPPVAIAANDSMGLDQAGPIGGAGSMGMPAGASTSGSTGTRGGLAGGALGGGGLAGSVRGAGQTAGSAVGGVAGGVANDTRMAGQAGTDTTSRTVAMAGESVSGAPHSTSLPGVLLSNAGPVSGAANSSGRLTASGKNISLESGTRITLGVIAR